MLSSFSTSFLKMFGVIGVGPLVDVSSLNFQSNEDTTVSSWLSNLAGEEGLGVEVASPLVHFIVKGVKLDKACVHDGDKNFFKDLFNKRKSGALHPMSMTPVLKELPPINLAKKARKEKEKDEEVVVPPKEVEAKKVDP
ncbi:hypothetical protein VNO80_25219 [Phaseolus coccineus]|uniref:Uncharacterized protein n=1 Tax=Phaseolus coccineus TaxID=3886 RepID=A0AAN9QT48_PHACN